MVEATTALIVAFILLSVVLDFFLIKDKNETEKIALVKQEAYKLFLYAEKQDWIGPEKMEWVAAQIIKLVPGKILKSVIKEEKVRDWLQDLYDEFKESLQN